MDKSLGLQWEKKPPKLKRPIGAGHLLCNLVPVSFGQRQDTELRNNQFPESKISRFNGACTVWLKIWRPEIKSMWMSSECLSGTNPQ